MHYESYRIAWIWGVEGKNAPPHTIIQLNSLYLQFINNLFKKYT